jgi:hypothetical protein
VGRQPPQVGDVSAGVYDLTQPARFSLLLDPVKNAPRRAVRLEGSQPVSLDSELAPQRDLQLPAICRGGAGDLPLKRRDLTIQVLGVACVRRTHAEIYCTLHARLSARDLADLRRDPRYI